MVLASEKSSFMPMQEGFYTILVFSEKTIIDFTSLLGQHKIVLDFRALCCAKVNGE